MPSRRTGPAPTSKWSKTVRPPRLGGAERVGVFATRSPFRPNPIGLTCVKLDRVELTDDGPIVHVLGADLRDGTPIYDIKPYIPFADCHPDATDGWIEDAPWQELDVEFPQALQDMVSPAKLPGSGRGSSPRSAPRGQQARAKPRLPFGLRRARHIVYGRRSRVDGNRHQRRSRLICHPPVSVKINSKPRAKTAHAGGQ